MTIYTDTDGSLTNVDPATDPELTRPIHPADLSGYPAQIETPSTVTAKTLELQARHADALRAAELETERAAAAKIAEYRAGFDAQTLESADLLGRDPADIIGTSIATDYVEIITRDSILRNDGARGWQRHGAPSESDTLGPYGLALTLTDPAELTEAETAELDRWISPTERHKIFRTPEGLVVDFKGTRTLLPGDSGRPAAIGLIWPSKRAQLLPGGYRWWDGPGTGLAPATVTPSTLPSELRRALDPEDLARMQHFADVAQAVLDASSIAADLRQSLSAVLIKWEAALGSGASMILIGLPLFQALLPILTEFVEEGEAGVTWTWRRELAAAQAHLAPAVHTIVSGPGIEIHRWWQR